MGHYLMGMERMGNNAIVDMPHRHFDFRLLFNMG